MAPVYSYIYPPNWLVDHVIPTVMVGVISPTEGLVPTSLTWALL